MEELLFPYLKYDGLHSRQLIVRKKLIEYLAIPFVNDVVSQKDFSKHLDYTIMSANFIRVRNE